MIHFGFSYTGLIFLLMLFIPNILWTKHKPKDYEKYVGNENKIKYYYFLKESVRYLSAAYL